MPRNSPSTRNGRFTGLDEVSPAEQVAFDGLTVATNVDIDRNLKLSRRPGHTVFSEGSAVALWGDGNHLIYAADGYLLDLTGPLLAWGSAPTYLHGVHTPIGVIVTSGQEMWVKPDGQVLRSYGMAVPDAPVVTQIAGGGEFRAGLVRLACTLAEPGRAESGASEIITVQTVAGSSLSVQLPASSYPVRLYLSSENGTELYFDRTRAGGSTITLYAPGLKGAKQLATAFSGIPVDPARTVAVYNGRLLYAEHSVLWYSEPFAYERFRLDRNFIPFEAPINLIAPVDGGVFVGTDQAHHFLRGNNIAEASIDPVAGYGAALTQPAVVEAHEHNFEGVNDEVSIWITRRGLVAGFSNGTLNNLSEHQLNLGVAVQGCVAMRRTAGMKQLLFCVRS